MTLLSVHRMAIGGHLRGAKPVVHQLLPEVDVRLGARLALARARPLELVVEQAPAVREPRAL